MTPEEKAKDLLRKFKFNEMVPLLHLKWLARVCIDEMIETANEAMLMKQSKRDWLQQVKDEIEKL